MLQDILSLLFLCLKIVKKVCNHHSWLIGGAPSVIMIRSDLGCNMVQPYKALPRPGVASQEASREPSKNTIPSWEPHCFDALLASEYTS